MMGVSHIRHRNIVTAMDNPTAIASLTRLGAQPEPLRFGGKALRLGKLIDAGLPTPPGFAIASGEGMNGL